MMDIVPVEGSCVSTGRKCKKSCDNLPIGNYQSCTDCNVYLTCSSVGSVQTRCAQGLSWNDGTKGCNWVTDTCKCLREYLNDVILQEFRPFIITVIMIIIFTIYPHSPAQL